MQQVAPGVHIDPDLGGCTVGAIETVHGVVLVDTPKQPSRALRWRSEVASLGSVEYLINTEHHIDHVFGNGFLPGTVVASRVTASLFWEDSVLGRNPLHDPAAYISTIEHGAEDLADDYKPRVPEIIFDGSMTLSFGELQIDLLALPGHVSAATAVYLRGERILFAGDNVFNGTMVWFHEADPYLWLETLDVFRSMEIETIIPGHGEPVGPEILDEMSRIVQGAMNGVSQAIDKGIPRDGIADALGYLGGWPIEKEHAPRADELHEVFAKRLYDQVVTHRASQA